MDLTDLVKKYKDVLYYQKTMASGVVMTILVGGLNKPNPKTYMDDVIRDFVGNRCYNEFIESSMDNAWVRVIIENFNNIKFEP